MCYNNRTDIVVNGTICAEHDGQVLISAGRFMRWIDRNDIQYVEEQMGNRIRFRTSRETAEYNDFDYSEFCSKY